MSVTGLRRLSWRFVLALGVTGRHFPPVENEEASDEGMSGKDGQGLCNSVGGW